MSEDSGIEYTEEIRQGMTPDGSEVVEDIVTAVDTETGDALVDDLIVSVAPDGSATVEETVAAVDDSGACSSLANTSVVITSVTDSYSGLNTFSRAAIVFTVAP